MSSASLSKLVFLSTTGSVQRRIEAKFEGFRQRCIFDGSRNPGAADATGFPRKQRCTAASCLPRRRQGAVSSAHRRKPAGEVAATLLVPVCAATSHAFSELRRPIRGMALFAVELMGTHSRSGYTSLDVLGMAVHVQSDECPLSLMPRAAQAPSSKQPSASSGSAHCDVECLSTPCLLLGQQAQGVGALEMKASLKAVPETFR